MKYDFTSIMDRQGRDAMALDAIGKGGSAPNPPKDGFDVIPMWVADMNFPACPTIPERIIERTNHTAYGYFKPNSIYFDSIIRWQQVHNHVDGLLPEHIGYENGVLGGVVTALNVLCSRGDNVLVHSPTYVGFASSLRRNGYNIVHSPLVLDENGIWRMDFDDMEQKIIENKIHAMIFCSPHNPCGRVWEREELEAMAALCQKHDVFIVSDEIWSDIVRPGFQHIPTQSVSDYAKSHTAAIYAPSKTFNLAGLIGSYHIVYNKWLRDRIDKEAAMSRYNSMNVLSMHALLGAYQPEGYEWVEELNQVIAGNVDYACDYITSHFPGISVSKPQGTYMLFLNCTDWCRSHNQSVEDVLHAGWDVGVAWQDGREFHGPATSA